MRLKEVLKEISYRGNPPLETEVIDIVYNSKKARCGALFVCLVGARADGHLFVRSAYEQGCRLFVTEREVSLPSDAAIMIVENTRAVLAMLSENFFKRPSDRISVIGVTGTKGKTTIVHIIQSLLNQSGIPTGRIGTVGAQWGDKMRKTVNTTPESYETQKLLAEMANDGCKAAAIEVSSLGVKHHRIDGIDFSIGVFTNITPDHIGGDEHKDFSEYYGWKKEFFSRCTMAIGCADDEATEDMMQNASQKILFGLDPAAQYRAANERVLKDDHFLGSAFDLFVEGKEYRDMRISLPGQYSVNNALAAIAVCHQMGIAIEDMRDPLSKVEVSGRTEPVFISNDYSVIIDYAHNGASLKNLLETMRQYKPRRILCLFGSVGDRAQLRRREMGLVAGAMCDLSIITTDDPNFEDPDQIIAEIAGYVREAGGEYVTVTDREEAIAYAVSIMQPGDMLILTGKGHERIMKVRGEEIPIDERACALEALKKKDVNIIV